MNQLASWMIEHPDIDNNGNQTNSVPSLKNNIASDSCSSDEAEFPTFWQPQVTIYLINNLKKYISI